MKKSLLFLFLTLSFSLIIAGCSSDDGNNLVLSTDGYIINMWDFEVPIDIVKGNGGYTATSSNSFIAEVVVRNNQIIITSRSNGQAIITVTDQEGKTATLLVKVNGTGVVPTTVQSYLNVGDSQVINIPFAGFGGYTLANKNEAFASSVLDGETIKVKALAKGIAAIDVTDKRGTSTTVTVYVFDINELKVLWGNTSISSGSTSFIGTIMEDGECEAISADPSIATVEIKNRRNISVKALKVGHTTITVSDKNGHISVLDFEVK